MSFRSNWVDWVRSFRKNQLQLVLFQKWPERPLWRVSDEFCWPKPKLQKRTKHEYWVKRGGLGVFISKNAMATCFVPEVAKKALGGRFRTSCVDQNRNCENPPNMSFPSNGVDWVRSFRKNQLQVVSFLKWPEWPSGAGFA
jgi:hypothetical protein